MLGLIALACFDAAGVAFMLYVLMNLHRELKRGRKAKLDLQPKRVAGIRETRGSLLTVHYAEHPESSAVERTYIGARRRVF